MKNELIFKRKYKEVLKTRIKLGIGKFIDFLINQHKFYRNANFNNYEFKGKELSQLEINRFNEYVKNNVPNYQDRQETRDIIKSSQYYSFNKIKSPASVCNIGCFYCKADNHFIRLNKKNIVYGLDFKGIIKFNKKFSNKRLKLKEGYPLHNLKKMESKGVKLDYTLFTRTAVLININELLSYMEIISKISKNVCFMEVFKLPTYKYKVLDVNEINMMNPIKMYKGMYIHNYPAILKMFGYDIIESEIFPNKKYLNDNLTSDHYFIYVHGRKN